jgi:hypothetical protein
MQKTIKFSDFMAKKHQIVGLTQQEEQFAEGLKHLFYILMALVAVLGLQSIPFMPLGGAETAFLYK